MKFPVVLIPLAALPLAAAEEESKPVVAIYDLEGTISESGRAEASLLGGLDMETHRPLTLFDLTRSLQKAAADPNVKAVVSDADDAVTLPVDDDVLREVSRIFSGWLRRQAVALRSLDVLRQLG